MTKILILYYSQTGNTEKMASAIAGAARNSGVEVELSYHVDSDELAGFDAVVIGVPTYHHDIPIDIKRLFEEASMKNVNLKARVGAVFGSFGWSGEAPKLVLEIMQNKFEMKVVEPPLLLKYTPDDEGLEKCRAFGKRISESLIRPA